MGEEYGAPPGVLSVKQAIGVVNELIKPIPILVTGEISEPKLWSGKFWYFNLRDTDGDALLNCFMVASMLPFPLEEGMKVLISGNFGVVEKSGRFSLTVKQLRASGEGALARAFQLLKEKLAKEGLTSEDRKRQLPSYIEKVVIVSSADAAGFGDFVRVARERFPGLQLVHVHTSVQGKSAETDIIAALRTAQGVRGADVIALVRGGGSMDDLHAFNSEPVGRAIAQSALPIIVGVGHERDVTIADLVADVRASTPSNAAELLTFDAGALVRQIERQSLFRLEVIRSSFSAAQVRIESLRRSRVAQIVYLFEMLQQKVVQSRQNRHQQIMHRYEVLVLQARALMASIEALAPMRVLERGYALVTSNGHAVTSAASFPLDEVEIVMHDGKVSVKKVTSTL